MKRLLQCAAFFVTLFATTAAFAATALVTTDLHLRTGPGTGYRIVASMPDGAVVNVGGCVRGYNWCRVDWNGYRGWASASYLAFREGRYRHRAFSSYGAQIGIPLIAGAVIGNTVIGNHHHRHHDYRRRDHRRYDHHDRHRHHRGNDHRGGRHHGGHRAGNDHRGHRGHGRSHAGHNRHHGGNNGHRQHRRRNCELHNHERVCH